MYQLKLTSAIAHEGAIKKKGSIIEVDEQLARDLLRRGKAELHQDSAEQFEADPQGAPEINLGKMNKTQLVALAEGLEIEGAAGMNKIDLLAAIKKYQEAEQ